MGPLWSPSPHKSLGCFFPLFSSSAPHMHLCSGPSRKERKQLRAFCKTLAHKGQKGKGSGEGKGFAQVPIQSEAGARASACVHQAFRASTLEFPLVPTHLKCKEAWGTLRPCLL